MARASTAPRRARDPFTDPDLVAIERAMNRIRRRQARRSLGRSANDQTSRPVDLEHAAVVDAIEAASETLGAAVSVGDVAECLGVDPSRGSRVVSAAIKAGYVQRVASQEDGRRILLTLTEAGRFVADHAHQHRRTLYWRLLDGWEESERHEFARLLTRFTDAMASQQAAAQDRPDGEDT